MTSVVLGLISAALAGTVAFGYKLPLIGSPRAAFFVLMVLGMAMCSRRMEIQKFGWTNPFNILGMVIGTVGLILVVAVAFRIKLPMIDSDRTAVLALAAIMALKVAVGLVRGWVA